MNVYLIVTILWAISFATMIITMPNLILWTLFCVYSVGLYTICLLGIPSAIMFKIKSWRAKYQTCEYCAVEIQGETKDPTKSLICKDCNRKYVTHIGPTFVLGITQEQEDRFWQDIREEDET